MKKTIFLKNIFEMFINIMFYYLVLCVISCLVKFQTCHAADPILSQTTVTDSAGNSADENSVVTFASIPTVSSYKASNSSYSSTGLEWYYSLHTLFIDTLVFPDGFPTDTINGIIDGTVTKQLIEGYSGLSIFAKFVGYVILIVIGITFIVIFPLIGGCFCCCRCCCGKCGGASFQSKEEAENVCKRRTYVVFLLLMITIICFGMVCVYITNANIGMAVNSFDSTVSDNMDDIESYVKIIVKQVKHIGNTNFNFTQDVINRDLDSIGYIVGIPVRTNLQTDSGILTALRSVLTLADRISGIATALAAVNTQVTVVENAAAAFTASMNVLTTIVTDTNTACSCGGPTMSDYALRLNTGNFPNLATQTLKITELGSTNFTALTESAKTDLNNVPERVVNETISTVEKIKSTVANFSEKITPMIQSIEDIEKMISDNFLSMTRSSLNTSNYMSYENYRYYGGVGIACLVLFIVLVMLFGLLFAMCGHKDVRPTERNCLSTCGGNFLMLSVFLVFLFSWGLLLLTTLTFAVGAPLKRFACEPITDTPYATEFSNILDTVIYKAVTGNESGSYIGHVILQNSTANITLTGLLEDCDNNKGIYSVLRLEEQINTTQITDYKTSIALDKELEAVNVSFSDVVVLTSDIESKLNDFTTAITIDFSTFYNELNADAMLNDIDNLISVLDTLSNNAGLAGTYTTQYTNHKTQAQNIKTYQLATLETAMATLNTTVAALEALVEGVDTSITDVKTSLNNSQNYLQANGSTQVTTEVTTFANRLYAVVDYYVNDTLYALNYELGACKPVYNAYKYLLRTSVCNYIVDSLNSFWFSLGWCVFFFIPSIIFATKLAKHYKRMDHAEEEPEVETEIKQPIEDEDESSSDEDIEEKKGALARENSFYRRFLRSKRIQDPFGIAVRAFKMRGNKVLPDDPPAYTAPRTFTFQEKKGADW